MVTYETLNCNGRLISLEIPAVMGILNVTSDSFYKGSRLENTDDVLRQAERMVQEGAVFLDIGAMSSRPGAEIISPQEEWSRLRDPFRQLRKSFPEVVISVDTLHSDTARRSLEEGADMINDISAGVYDNRMMEVVSDFPVPYIMMHMQGRPENMQIDPVYADVVTEVIDFFTERVETAEKHGIVDLILDPGFGFGKTLEHNYELLANLHAFRIFRYPVLAGMSRKGMIQKLLDVSSDEALNGTTAAHMIALSRGVRILRVHDVKEAVQGVRIWEKINSPDR